MKKILLLALSFSLITIVNSQNPVLTFDGTDDYIDLGIDAGNGIRTIEMWFKLDETIDPQLNDFVTLAAREINGMNNINEFAFSFQPSNVLNPGKLRFDIDGTQPFKSVYSDNDTWNANQWYHVAAVIDSVNGMMLFVDGIKQINTHPYTGATSNSTSITTIGCWGNLFDRFFKGSIDDVRFSSQALYSSNFTPPCPDAMAMSSTIGLWNFNEGSGSLAADSSSNNYDGQLIGAIRIFADICLDSTALSIPSLHNLQENSLSVYPNPSNGIFHFMIKNDLSYNFDLTIYNSVGQIIKSEKITKNTFDINISNEKNGIYYYQIIGSSINESGKLMKE